VKYAYVQEHSARWPVSVCCELLEVSVSGYHDFVGRPAPDDDMRLVTEIRAVHARSRGAYGWPRVWRALVGSGIAVGKERTRRLMQQHGIRGRQKRRYVRTTVRDQSDPVAENVLNRDFSPAQINQVWAGDITYIPTAEGWLFLAIVLDLASRKIVGYALADHMRSELAVEALTRAAWGRRPAAGFIFHSDQGSQYTSVDFRTALERFGGKASMSRRGNCWDNAPSESCFGSLKTERVYGAKYATIAQAKADVLDWLHWYNRERLHSAIGYRSPHAFETSLCTAQTAQPYRNEICEHRKEHEQKQSGSPRLAADSAWQQAKEQLVGPAACQGAATLISLAALV
jgi:putative transposase